MSAYKDYMDRVGVTPEEHEALMKNIEARAAEAANAPEQPQLRKKKPVYRWLAPAAAAAVLLLVIGISPLGLQRKDNVSQEREDLPGKSESRIESVDEPAFEDAPAREPQADKPEHAAPLPDDEGSGSTGVKCETEKSEGPADSGIIPDKKDGQTGDPQQSSCSEAEEGRSFLQRGWHWFTEQLSRLYRSLFGTD